jgi:hypothetical protein
MQAADPIVAPTWTAAWAAVATAVFAIVQIVREIRRDKIRSRTDNARAEALAYRLRRQLRSWVGPELGEDDIHRGEHFERWIRQAQNTGMLPGHLDRAEKLVDELMTLRPEAPGATGRAIDGAYVYFLEGTRRLNEYVARERPENAEFWDWHRLRTDSEKDLRDCVLALERHVLRGTLTAERDLLSLREAEDPLNRMVEEMFEKPQQPPRGSSPS